MKGFFRPESIAVIGASADPDKVGGMILRNIISSGFRGKIYPVNLKGGYMAGLPVMTSVEQAGNVDLAVISVPTRNVVPEMRKLAGIGTKNVIIITAGFREEGAEGLVLENEVKRIASDNGMRVMGPNCFGLINTHNGINLTFSSLMPPKGNAALCSQSGAVGATMFDWSRMSRVGISGFASLGNKMDVNEADMITYFDGDPETKVIGIYSEGISDGTAFISAVEGMKNKKPIVFLKSGRTSAGSRAASSHTGALAGSDSVYDAVFRKLNIIRARDLDEMFDSIAVLSLSKAMERDGIAVITNAGGLGVMAADACSDSRYVSLAELSPDSRRKISEEIPSAASVNNPIDLRGDARNEDIVKAIKIISKDEATGGIIVLASPLDMIDLNSIADGLSSVSKETNVPIAVCFAGGSVAEEASAELRKNGVPSFPTPDRAVRALSVLREYKIRSGSGTTELVLPRTSGRKGSLKVMSKAKKEGRISLSEEEGKRILSSYGIPVPPEYTAVSAHGAVGAAEKIGFPVVMKILSPDIHHKTDVGGVVVGIKDSRAAADAYETIVARCKIAMPDARIDGVSVQKMAPGQEVILSMIRDDQFGPVISFGLGGIYVEIIGEISQATVPMTAEEMDAMISSTKAFRLLSGARGKPPADIGSLKEIMLRLMKIAEENPELYELEINPVMVGKKDEGSWAVDALATMRWDDE